jgi:hypothetical protein
MAFIEEILFTKANRSDHVQLDNDDYISNAPATPNRDTRRPPKFVLNAIDTAKKEMKMACKMNAAGSKMQSLPNAGTA